MPVSELNQLYNLRTAEARFQKLGYSKTTDLKIAKMLDQQFSDRFQQFGGQYYANTTTLPALTRESIDIPYQGTNLKEKGALNFGNETSITFKTDSYLALRALFEERMFGDGNPLDGSTKYCVGEDSTIEYYVINDKGRIVRGIQFAGVFINSIGEVSYDQTTNEVVTFDVGFNFSYWCPLSLDGLQLDLDGVNDSDSANTNKSVIYQDHFNLVEDKLNSTDPNEC